MKTLGFTGTKKGMAPRQMKAVRQLLYDCGILHLGDCVGADAEAFEIAGETGIHRVGHPPSEDIRRAFLEYEYTLPLRSYLDRNTDIARDGIDGIIAAPGGWVETQRSGTWSTVRRARNFGRKIWIVRPDGSMKVENG